MNNKINKNYKLPYKIRNNWEDIKKLIALGHELDERIARLEEKAKNLWEKCNNIKKNNV